MPDLGTQIGQARQAGYSDADITAFLAKDPSLGPKVAQAKAAGYSDGEIADHLATPAQQAAPQSENVFQKALRLTGQASQQGTQAYQQDLGNYVAKVKAGQSLGPMDYARPVMDAIAAGPGALIKGVADATFGDKPVHLPATVAGIPVPQALQNVNSKGLTGGDIASFAIPVAGELNGARELNAFAKGAGLAPQTAQNVLAASRGVTAAPQASGVAQTVQQFDQAGVRPTLAAMGQGNARVAKAIAENPLAGVRTRANLQASIDDTAQAANRVANQYGQPAERGAAGEAVQQGVQDFNDRFSKRAEALYTPIFDKINAAQAQKVQAAQQAAQAQNAGRTLTALPDAAGDLPGAASFSTPEAQASAVIKPDATADVLSQINARGDSPALRDLFSTPQVAKLTAAVNDPASLSFMDLRNARTWVRTAQKDDALRQGVSQSDLGRLEGALTQDIYSNAGNIAGPQAVRQLQQADSFYRLGSQRISGALQKFVGKSDDMAGENTYDRIQRMASDRGGADTARLTALQQSLKPSEWGDVAASTIQRMGQAPDGTFSINRFVTAADRLSSQGKDLLFGTAENRAALDNLVDVARKQKNVEQAANHSNSGSQVQALATVGGLLNPSTTIPTIGALFGAGLTGEVLTNPNAARALASLGRAKSTQAFASQASAIRRLAVKDATLLPVANAADSFLRGQPVPAAADTSQAPAN